MHKKHLFSLCLVRNLVSSKDVKLRNDLPLLPLLKKKNIATHTSMMCVLSFEFQKTIRTCSSYMTHTAAGIAYCIANLCAWRTCTWTPTTCFASCHPLSQQITHTPICKFQRVATGSFQKKTQNKNKVLKAKQPTPKRAWSNVHLYKMLWYLAFTMAAPFRL